MINKNTDIAFLIIRMTIGLLMLMHGWEKIQHGVSFLEELLASKGIPSFIAYGVYLGEVLAPILIIIGFRTRLAAITFAFTTVFALLVAHPEYVFSLNTHGHGGWAAELLGLYTIGAISLFFTGAGKYALSSTNKWD